MSEQTTTRGNQVKGWGGGVFFLYSIGELIRHTRYCYGVNLVDG
jgi:hypothetical protein